MARTIPPYNNGALCDEKVCEVTLSYADDGTQVTFDGPVAGDIITGVYPEVLTAFNDSGTDYLNVGIQHASSPDTDKFVDDVDCSSTGFKTVQSVLPYKVGTGETVVAQYDGANSDATAGRARIHVKFIRPSA